MKRANKDNYRCRSAYKLIELDDKFHFLQPGKVVIDCGASPGINLTKFYCAGIDKEYY